MGFVRSTWADDEVQVGKGLWANEWQGAGELPLDGIGSVLVKNDASYLYIAIDVVADSGDDPGTGDHFWLVVDEGGDGAVTPNRDRLYSPWPSKRDRLGRSYFLGERAVTPLHDLPPECQLQSGFADSPAHPLPHRTWEMRLPLSELGVVLGSTGAPPVLDVGFRIGSDTPAIHYETTAGLLLDFSDEGLSSRPAAPGVALDAVTPGARPLADERAAPLDSDDDALLLEQVDGLADGS